MIRYVFCIPIATLALGGCGGTPLQPWHKERLGEEFTAAKVEEVQSLADYLELEERLFAQLEDRVYSQVGTGPEYGLVRYSSGSAADPLSYRDNWNRTREIRAEDPLGGVLLLHGMSDSPYSLRALAEVLGERGYWVRQADMQAAVRIGMQHLAESVGDEPLHIVGYSTGAALALDYSLDALDGLVAPLPASLVLVSPAVRVHGAAAFASVKDTLGAVPGMRGLTWLSIMPEFDPYKYNSFATNAGDVVHRLTRDVDRRIAARSDDAKPLPPILAFKSTVDATVTTDAIVDSLLARLAPHRHELVLFDINRYAAKSTLLTSSPGPMTERVMTDDSLPFGVMLISNEDSDTRQVVARYKAPLSNELEEQGSLEAAWPVDAYSLSHVALPFPPDDPLYGREPPADSDKLFFGDIAIRGERDLYKLPGDWLLRMRYNPFYSLLEDRTLGWLAAAGDPTE
jgi:pimeloyl-ACP methyl ester carboxylesterase